MSKDIAHRLVAWPVADRRALLAYVDELLAELNEQAANESSAYAKRLAAIEHGGVCIWCGDAIELTGKDMASAVEWARKHDAECPDNPLHSRLAEAEAYGKAQQRWAHEWRDKHDALTAENAALREKVAAYEVVRLQLAERGDRYSHECVALRKDAERYRWLRTQHANILLGPVHVAGIGALTSTGLDAAIDAAMEQSHDK